MATLFRLAGRQALNQFIVRNCNPAKCGMLSLVRPVTLKSQPAPPNLNMGHDERNMKLGRPQSPHLTIYAPQLTTLLSISHRATGMALAGYLITLGAAAVILPESVSCYLDMLEEAKIGFFFIFVGKMILAFPMTYHFWNGIRHLLWDFGLCLTLREVYLTGYVMLVLAIGSALALSVM